MITIEAIILDRDLVNLSTEPCAKLYSRIIICIITDETRVSQNRHLVGKYNTALTLFGKDLNLFKGREDVHNTG